MDNAAHAGPWRNSKVPYLVEPMDSLRSRLLRSVVFAGPAQSGKALHVHTPIATPTGWTLMGKLRVGDEVFGADGKPCKVTFVTETMLDHKCYRLGFDDGTSIVADAEHQWAVSDLLSENKKVVTTETVAQTFAYGKKARSRYAIDVAAPLETPAADLPIDPYVLGAWLGDGHSYNQQLTLHIDETHIVDRIRAAGHAVEICPVPGTKSVTVKVDHRAEHGDTLRRRLSALGLMATDGLVGSRKAIPLAYLRASRAQRVELLRGLMDTDGHVTESGVCEITSTLPRLADGIIELLCSLGYKPRRNTHKTSCRYKGEVVIGPTERMTFMPRLDEVPFHLPRKLDMLLERGHDNRQPSYTGRRFITKVEPVTSRPVRCIQVDSPDHLYLAGRQMVPTHNTEMLLNWVGYSIVVDPMDMLVFTPTQSASRDFSTRRIGRMIRHAPEMKVRQLKGRGSDNIFDKHFTNGLMLTLSWPSVTELAGRPVARCALTDYDRMPEDVDGDGAPFDLAMKRNTTFKSFGMTLAESSPSYPILDPRWTRKTLHEAPPTKGILALYNRGDRRKWYWPCPRCGEHFSGRWEHLEWDTKADAMSTAATVRMVCPVCGGKIQPNERDEMNFFGTWVAEGQTIGRDGLVRGEPRRSSIASYWLNGVAAAFTTWQGLVQTYLDALAEFDRNGTEEALKKFFNTDIGDPYLPKAQLLERLPETLKARAEPLPEREVPEGVRFLVANVDVQKNAFVVQVHGIAPGAPFDVYVIDRFTILKSKRLDDDGERAWCKPATYLEDWDLIKELVMDRTYPLAGQPDREMRIKLTTCDSGGRKGVTTTAYNYYRKLKADGDAGRFHLLMGRSNPLAPRTKVEYPDSGKKDRLAAARGDVPVLYINSNIMKDTLHNRLDSVDPGSGMIHFGQWLEDWWFNELCAETRTDKGWVSAQGVRNEAWDLLYYCLSACVSELLRAESIDWSKPPIWASEGPGNPMILVTGQEKSVAPEQKDAYDLTRLGQMLA